uniref:AlNc14C66G4699 protein n=1 Tax=Albugo laibachii Nc14 TaxID=890382 RepID=F0WDI0_9STRA|nr:AlNc14C66G4699 [Albugo laibachii Nc14]|eukprot:CCA19252.1 AlNc14C66G4699 [Albugo laibachii Nc14]
MNKHDTTKATRIPREQKLVLCKRHSEYPKLSLRALNRWAGSAFKLPKNPSHATLLVLFEKPVTEDAVRANRGRKTNQYVCFGSIEHAFLLWINRCELLQMPVFTWATMRAKAEKIRSTLVLDATYVLDAKLKGMVFSDGWLQKLLERLGLKTRRVQGEATSTRAADVDEGRAALRMITSKKALPPFSLGMNLRIFTAWRLQPL